MDRRRTVSNALAHAFVALAAALAALSAAAQTFEGAMSGHWWNPAREREGQFVAFESVNGRRVAFLAYFTYGAGGSATWYVGNADYAAGATSITMPMVAGSGGRFGPDYRPGDVTIAPAGTATLTFVSCSAMRVTYALSQSFTVELTRAVGALDGVPCVGVVASAPALASAASPFPAGCGGAGGTNYVNAEVEPHLAVNPRDANHLLAAWQQDRWSNGSARGVVAAASFDGGRTWTRSPLPFSRCGGGSAANGGNFERATDPWVSFGADGTAYAMGLATTGGSFAAGSVNAMLVSRSPDGGRTWGNPAALVTDTAPFFHDKNTITADPHDARFAYAVWDRVRQGGPSPSIFTRTTDRGATWEPARVVFEPGAGSQTIGNLVVVLPDGTLVNLFAHLESGASGNSLKVIRSSDRGATWSDATKIADLLSIGARDPRSGAGIRDGAIIPQAAVGPDGTMHVVWQDARFSGGARDEIAHSRSTDAGLTWSTPVRVNAPLGTQAFTPAVAVRADGTIGVTYYDLRDDTVGGVPLETGYFLAHSADGLTWSETRLDGPFDLATAPQANGLFLGDYMGLAAAGGQFLALYGRTTGDPANPTDIFLARSSGAVTAKTATGSWAAQAAAPWVVDAGWRARLEEATRAVIARRAAPPR
ncbi:MAG: exo-alpha-sialidase [Betaproteobacteria bacterium]|nr:exo-alpha-sialidase [Betaproteobacteria bacterium]